VSGVEAATEAQDVAWDLEPLADGRGAAGVEDQLEQAIGHARAFAQAHEGKVAELDAEALAAAMRELEAIAELAGRAGSYAALSFATDTADPERGALLARVQERSTEIETALLFFELEWAAVPDEQADVLLSDERLGFCAHHLRLERRYRPHLLSKPEERLAAEKAQTGRSAWERLFAELTSAITVRLPDEQEEAALDVALARLFSPDRELRRTTAEAVTSALEPGLRTRAFVFNTLLHDKAVDDRLRAFPHWLRRRNLSNEASDESVQALIEAVRGHYELPRRWYRLKARLLGLDRIADYDRMAAVGGEDPAFSWSEARELVVESFHDFSPELGALSRRFFDESWIDAPPRPGKRGGAFCAYTVPSAHPYLMLNFTARRRDVLVLGHELGHGLHAALAAPQGVFHQSTPLTLAETASVFGETVVLHRLLDAAESPDSRLGLLAESLEGAIATVFRQVSMYSFEDSVHGARRGEGELSVARLGELWAGSQRELFGDAVELTEGYSSWWSYVPHFVNTPGYVYAYAYGQLLALSVYERARAEGPSFTPRYLELLKAGGSQSPRDLGQMVGIDLADPGFWDGGLVLIERQLEAAEAAAEQSGRLAA